MDIDITDVLQRVQAAKQAVDYPTANKLTALLLLKWQVQTADDHDGLLVTYLRSYPDLVRNDPWFDLVTVGTADVRVSIGVPALSPTFIALLFQIREANYPFLAFGFREPPQGGKKLGAPDSMAHLLVGFEGEFPLFQHVLR